MSQQINLFNPALLRQKKVFTARTLLSALALLLCGSVALLLVGQHSVRQLAAEAASGEQRLNQARKRQAQAQVDFAPRQKSPAIGRALAEAEAELASLDEVIAALGGDQIGNTTGYARYFKALARQSAGELWLTGVTIAGGGRHIGIKGRALDAAMVPAYVKRLSREPVMQGKYFGSLAISRAALAPGRMHDVEPRTAPGITPAIAPTSGQGDTGKLPELAPFVDFTLQSGAGAAR